MKFVRKPTRRSEVKAGYSPHGAVSAGLVVLRTDHFFICLSVQVMVTESSGLL
jgi:hypothetical protein